jgi:hypothetical protein
MLSDDIQDIKLSESLNSVMALFVEQMKGCTDITDIIKSRVTEWIASQPYIFKLCFEISGGKVSGLKINGELNGIRN